jgi:perosamine synthetase
MFCGHPGIRIDQLVGTRKTCDVYSWFGKRDVFYVHRGRTAIRLACRLLGLGPGNEILAPSYNCGSEIDALLNSGASVTLYRVTRSTAVDLVDLEKKITPKTKAVYVTHYFGFPQPSAEVKKICSKRGLYLIEDCALTLFSKQSDQILGMEGDISIFSLPKTLPVPDGGILLANNRNLRGNPIILSPPNPVRVFRDTLPGLKSGFLRSLSTRAYLYPLFKIVFERSSMKGKLVNTKCSQAKPNIPASYYYDDDLTEKKMSYLTERMLRTFDTKYIVARRRENFCTYLALLPKSDVVEPLFNELRDGICPLSFPIIVKNRDEVCKKLRERGIDAGGWWKGYHRSLPWADFKDACFLKDHCLTLPVHQDIDSRSVHYVVHNFKEVLKSLR